MSEGLYGKYSITKADGTPIDGFAFVLRIKDLHARNALLAYAASVCDENPELADVLIAEVNAWYAQFDLPSSGDGESEG